MPTMIPTESGWIVGATRYTRVQHNGADYAVPHGQDAVDATGKFHPHTFAVKTDPNSMQNFFVNMGTRVKAWELPENAVGNAAWRARVVRMYKHYAPEKAAAADSVLQMYQGKEEVLIQELVKKYGPEPPATPERPSASPASVPPSDAHDGSVVSSAPSIPPAPGSWHARVEAMYRKYKPEKLHTVTNSLRRYKGQEAALMQHLVETLGPEPEPEASPAVADGASGAEIAGAGGEQRSYRDRVIAMYEAYAPTKIAKAESHLTAYAGQEEALIVALVDRYGPEPAPPTSSTDCAQRNADQPTAVDSAGQEDAAAGPVHADVVPTDSTSRQTPSADNAVEGRDNAEASNAHESAAANCGAGGHGGAADDDEHEGNEGDAGTSGGSLPPMARIDATRPLSVYERIYALYLTYNPAKLTASFDAVTKAERQKEVHILVPLLVEKYGPEPPLAAAHELLVRHAPLLENAPGLSLGRTSSAEVQNGGVQPNQTSNSDGNSGDAAAPTPAIDFRALALSAPTYSSGGGGTPRRTADGQQGGASALRSTSQDGSPGGASRSGGGASAGVGTGPSADGTMAGGDAASAGLADAGTQRQRQLFTFLQDREQRLADATKMYHEATATIQKLEERNATLAAESNAVRAKKETELLELQRDKAAAEAKCEEAVKLWELEKQRLVAAHSVELVAADRALNEIKVELEQERIRRVGEEAKLQKQIAASSDDVESINDQTRELLKALDRKEETVRQLREEVQQMEERNFGVPKRHAMIQTETQDFIAAAKLSSAAKTAAAQRDGRHGGHDVPPLKGLPTQHHDPHANDQSRGTSHEEMEEGAGGAVLSDADVEAAFDALLSQEAADSTEMDSLQTYVGDLERQLAELIKERETIKETGTSERLEKEKAASDMAAKADEEIMQHLERNRVLEARVAELETKLRSLPGATETDAEFEHHSSSPTTSRAHVQGGESANRGHSAGNNLNDTDPQSAARGPAAFKDMDLPPEATKLMEEAEELAVQSTRAMATMRRDLEAARTLVREQKREIATLRGRVAMLMSIPKQQRFKSVHQA